MYLQHSSIKITIAFFSGHLDFEERLPFLQFDLNTYGWAVCHLACVGKYHQLASFWVLKGYKDLVY